MKPECTCLFPVAFSCNVQMADSWTHLQFSSRGFHFLLSRWFRSLSAQWGICFSWLGFVSGLKLCWLSVARVWMYSPQHWQSTDLMRSRFEKFFGSEYDIDTPLSSTGLQPSQPTLRIMWSLLAELTDKANEDLFPEGVSVCDWTFGK